MNIVNVGYQSTNYYLIDIKGGKLLVDCGWPGTLTQFSGELKRKGNSIQDIKYLLVTHFHPDHAGMTQELKKLGIKHILLDVQVDFIPQMTKFFAGKKNYPYVPISTNDSIRLQLRESRAFLAGIGLQGEIIHTDAIHFGGAGQRASQPCWDGACLSAFRWLWVLCGFVSFLRTT